MIRIIETRSAEETLRLGAELGRGAKRGDVFALTGGLGSGKTVIAKGIALGLGIDEEITSPTFTLLEVYERDMPLYHFDLYRIEADAEFDQLFFEEYWEGGGVSVIEWADRAGARIPRASIKIEIEYVDSETRRIRIERPDN